MGWEKRHGMLFYYRSVRVGRHVFKEYCGSGARGEAAAQADADRRAEQAKDRQAEQERRQKYELAHSRLLALHGETNAILAAAMTAAGYHRHDRGAWRRKRGATRD